MDKCGRLFYERAQHLIVPGGRKTKLRADGFFFGTDVAPPLSLKGQYRQVTLGQTSASGTT